MTKNLKYLLLGGFALLAVGFSIGRYVVPNKSIESTNIEKEVKREETVIVREETRPDGTKIKETTNTTKKETTDKKEIIKIVENAKPQWKASALAGYNLDKSAPVYGVAVDRRILGNIYMGAWGTTDKQVGLSVSMEF